MPIYESYILLEGFLTPIIQAEAHIIGRTKPSNKNPAIICSHIDAYSALYNRTEFAKCLNNLTIERNR